MIVEKDIAVDEQKGGRDWGKSWFFVRTLFACWFVNWCRTESSSL